MKKEKQKQTMTPNKTFVPIAAAPVNLADNPKRIPEVRYIDKNALARAFGVSPRTVCRWVADGMPALRLPTRLAKNPNAGTLRFRLADVERWIEAQNEVAKR